MFKVSSMFANIQSKVGLFLIVSTCVFYYIFVSRFAELHVQLPFLDFPIFVGEWLLSISIILCLWNLRQRGLLVVNKWSFLLGAYIIYVLYQAFFGYLKWSPLALRHAAMFYYPLFAVMVYSFFSLVKFDPKKIIFTYFLWGGLFFVGYAYGIYTYFALALIAALSVKSVRLQYMLIGVVFLSVPYNHFIYTARMMIVANFIAIGFVMCLWIYISGFSIRRKVVILCLCFISLCTVFAVNRESISTIVNVKQLRAVYARYDQKIKSQEGFQLADRGVIQLFNPNLKGVQKKNIRKKTVREKVVVIKKPQVKVEVKQIENVEKKIVKTVVDENPIPVQLVEKFVSPVIKVEQRSVQVGTKVRKVTIDPVVEIQQSSAREGEKLDVQKVRPVAEIKPHSVLIEHKDPHLVIEVDKVLSPEGGAVNLKESKEQQIKSLELSQKWQEFNTETDRVFNRAKNVYSNRGVKKNVNNGIFRILIWKDLVQEMITERAFFGFGFGKPTRSKSLEALNWGSGEWKRDGWVAVHNSFLHIIYRTGIIGVILLLMLLKYLIRMVISFLRTRDVIGILLCSIIINWFVAANFLLILELPQMAIPLWTIIGFTAYYYQFAQHQDKAYVVEK